MTENIANYNYARDRQNNSQLKHLSLKVSPFYSIPDTMVYQEDLHNIQKSRNQSELGKSQLFYSSSYVWSFG